MPFKIISGGQTGADQAALFAASALGLETGGWAPPKFLTSAGKQPHLLGSYFGLHELLGHDGKIFTSTAQQYIGRSMQNVDEADITIAFFKCGTVTNGTDKTVGYACTRKWRKHDAPVEQSLYKPVFVVNALELENEEALAEFIKKHNPKIVNVCGSRGKRYKDDVWAQSVSQFLQNVFKRFIQHDDA